MAGEKATSSGAGLAQMREAGAGSSELAKAMAVGRAVSIGLTLEAARRRGKVGDFWNGVETGEDRGEMERVRGNDGRRGRAEGQVEVVAVYRGAGRWPTPAVVWMDKSS